MGALSNSALQNIFGDAQTITADWKYNDDQTVIFGTDSDISMGFNSGGNRVEIIEGTTFGSNMYVVFDNSNNRTTFHRDQLITDNNLLILGSGSDFSIGYRSAGNVLEFIEGTTLGSSIFFRLDNTQNYTEFTRDVLFGDNITLLFGTGSDRNIQFDGSNWIFGGGSITIENQGGGSDPVLLSNHATNQNLELTGNFIPDEIGMNDNDKLRLGTGRDAEIYYDGTNLIIDPDAVGSGAVQLGGNLDLNSNNLQNTGAVGITKYYSMYGTNWRDGGGTGTFVALSTDEGIWASTETADATALIYPQSIPDTISQLDVRVKGVETSGNTNTVTVKIQELDDEGTWSDVTSATANTTFSNTVAGGDPATISVTNFTNMGFGDNKQYRIHVRHSLDAGNGTVKIFGYNITY